MLSIITVPKAFLGHTRIVQDNAISSWTRLSPAFDIVLFGDDPGVAEAAARHNVRHEPAITRNEFGTPLIADVFTRMNKIARYPIIGFVNADIILLDDFLPAIEAIARTRSKFLAVSSRFNCRIEQQLSFDPGWEVSLRMRARTEKRMYPAGGSDIFVYNCGLFGTVPPFAIGRGYWDNWLMHEARGVGATLIDLTAAVTAVHQDHPYNTVSGLPSGDVLDRDVYATEEGQRNLALAGGQGRLYTVFDATEIMGANRRLYSTTSPWLIHRRIKAWLRRRVRSWLPDAA